MSVNQRSKVAYGLSQPDFAVGPIPIIASRVPTNSDFAEIGTIWIDSSTNQIWSLTSITNNNATWTELDNINIIVGGLAWHTITTTGPVPMVVNSGYELTNAGAVSLTLPATAVQGSQLYIATNNAALGGFQINQNAGQNIIYGSSASTVGVAGYINTTLGVPPRYQSMILICTITNTQWTIFACNCPNLYFA